MTENIDWSKIEVHFAETFIGIDKNALEKIVRELMFPILFGDYKTKTFLTVPTIGAPYIRLWPTRDTEDFLMLEAGPSNGRGRLGFHASAHGVVLKTDIKVSIEKVSHEYEYDTHTEYVFTQK